MEQIHTSTCDSYSSFSSYLLYSPSNLLPELYVKISKQFKNNIVKGKDQNSNTTRNFEQYKRSCSLIMMWHWLFLSIP